MPTYTVTSRLTTAITGGTGAALSRDAAIVAAVALAASGPTGTEGHVYTCDQTAASGPTGTFAFTRNTTSPLTGTTVSATGPEAACMQVVATVGPTGPGAGIAIQQTS